MCLDRALVMMSFQTLEELTVSESVYRSELGSL